MLLDEMKVFSTVAQTKSFSKAGKLLHLSQPAISAKIQAMEDDLGQKLFTRTAQGVILTEAGTKVLEYSSRFLELQQSMNDDLSKLLNTNPPLAIGASCTSGNYALPCCISSFKEKYSQANIKLDISNTVETLAKLNKGEIDLAVVDGSIETNHVVKVLDTIDLVFVAAATDKFKKSKLTFKELRTKPFILRETGAAVRTVMKNLAAQHNLTIEDFNIVAEMNSLHSIKSAVLGGTGITLLPLVAVQKDIESGALRVLHVEGVDLKIDVNLVYRIDEETSPITQKFVKFLTDRQKRGFCWDEG